MTPFMARVQYRNKFGRHLGTINIDLAENDFSQLHLKVADAGQKVYGSEWDRAVVVTGKTRLVVENGRR